MKELIMLQSLDDKTKYRDILLSHNSYPLFPQTISHDGKLCGAWSCSSLPFAIVQEQLSDKIMSLC
jgi:hypothetical protein